jgi:prevent-host-death family protein
MHSVNIHEAKTHLSRLLEEVQQGKEIIIAKAGKPIARLTAYENATPPLRVPGGLEGQIWISPDFDDPDPELEKLFYEGPIFPEKT